MQHTVPLVMTLISSIVTLPNISSLYLIFEVKYYIVVFWDVTL